MASEVLERSLYNGLYREMSERIVTDQREKGRPLTNDEKRQIGDDFMKQKVFVDRAWRSDPEKRLIELTADERENAYVPITRIPDEEVNTATSYALGKTGKKPTDQQIERAYFYIVSGDKPRALAILRGE